MAYATDTTSKKGLRLRFVVLIAGIEQVFVPKAVSPTSLVSDRTQVKALLQDSVSMGEERIDMVTRALTGGGLSFKLRDDADGTLLSLFGYRATTPRTNLVTTAYARGGAESTITVDDTTGFASSGTIHIGAEAISYTGTTATTFTTATRAAYGTRKGDHRSGVSGAYLGSLVTQYPQSWRGRRVTLKAGYEDDDGTIADLATIGTFQCSGPPAAVDDGNTYQIECEPLSNIFREARCYVGNLDATIQDWDAGIGGETYELFEYNDQNPFVAGSSVNAHALIETDVGSYRLSAVSSVVGTGLTVGAYDYLTPSATQLFGSSGGTGIGPVGRKVRHVAMLTGSPVDITMMLLTSIEGDATNSDWDVLPGDTNTGLGTNSWRFGAGIDAGDINYADPDSASSQGSILHLRNEPIVWRHLLMESIRVPDLLQEFCRSTGSFWYINSSGKLSFERLRDTAPASFASQSVTFDDSTVISAAPVLRVSEENIAHTIEFRSNWEPLVGRYLVNVRTVDWELKERYPESAQEFVEESKFVRLDMAGYPVGGVDGQTIGGSSGVLPDEYAARLRRAQNLSSLGEVFVDLECAWNASQLVPGQIVDLNLPRTPDTKGARLTSARGFIVARRLNPNNATVSFTVRVMPKGRIIAPVGVISSVATTTNANDTWTLNTSHATIDPDVSSPAGYFAANWQIKWYDRSTGTVLGPYTVQSVNTGTHQIVFTASPGSGANTPAAGDYCWPVVNQASTDAASGYDENDFGWMTDESGANEDSRLS